MLVPMGQIIEDALPLVEKQMGEDYDKYQVEAFLKQSNGRYEGENDCIAEIVSAWAVPDTSSFVFEFLYQDLNTRAFKFDDLRDVVSRLLGPSSYLNPFVTFAIPVLDGRVMDFEV